MSGTEGAQHWHRFVDHPPLYHGLKVVQTQPDHRASLLDDFINSVDVAVSDTATPPNRAVLTYRDEQPSITTLKKSQRAELPWDAVLSR